MIEHWDKMPRYGEVATHELLLAPEHLLCKLPFNTAGGFHVLKASSACKARLSEQYANCLQSSSNTGMVQEGAGTATAWCALVCCVGASGNAMLVFG